MPEKLPEKIDGFGLLTRKQYIIPVWNDNNPDYPIDENYIQW